MTDLADDNDPRVGSEPSHPHNPALVGPPESSTDRAPLGRRRYAERQPDRVRESRKRYRERHPEKLAARLKRWKDANPDKVKAYRERYRENHLEESRAKNRERERERQARLREEKHRREARRAYMRDWYAKNREHYLTYQREYRAAQRAADPEKYRETMRERNKRWRDGHRAQENAKLRAKYRDDPEVKAKRAAKYDKTHTDEVRARRRASYAANCERERATQARYRAREKFRRDAGLPPRHVQRTPREVRLANTAAAEEFFTRPRTGEDIARLRTELHTPPELLAAWMRDCKQARAAHHLAEEKEMHARVGAELRSAPKPPTPEQIEEARLDAIGKQINEHLRPKAPPRRVHHLDPAAPHPMLHHPNQTGMNR
jgi:hypothetical protein